MRKWKEGGRKKKETGGWRGERREGIERGEEGRGRTREEGGLSVICETKTRVGSPCHHCLGYIIMT